MSFDKENTLSTDADGTEAELRRRAEERLKTLVPEPQRHRTEDETRRRLHELQVHQIELEMQNAELSRARDEAERAVERYSDLYDFAPVGYVTLDREGVIRTANLTVATLLKTERSRLVGRRLGLFVGADTRTALNAFLDRVFASRAREACEVTLLNGGKVSLFVQIEAVAAASGQECRVAIIDISLRRQLEQALAGLHLDLLARVADLEAVNIELEAFTYSVSHDLRGPLTVIAGYCDILDHSYVNQLDGQGREFIREIHAGTLRMSRLIDTLLKFSSAKSGQITCKQVDLSQMVEEVALGLRAEEPARQVRFQIAKGIIANGDASLLRVVLDNLIGNAWKYSDNREQPLIEFGVTEVAGASAYFIRDNGRGFDMADANLLFLPFQRLPGTDAEGHGIGLATVARIVTRHGGRVWAESTPGEGASFYFTLDESRREMKRGG